MAEGIPWAVSSDVCGLTGSPQAVLDIYPFAFDDPKFEGVELLAQTYPQNLEDTYTHFWAHSIPVTGIHGRFGGDAKLRDFFMMDSHRLIHRFADIADYILFQPQVLQDPTLLELMRVYPKQRFYVKNHPQSRGGHHARRLVSRMKQTGIDASYMWDVGHSLAEIKADAGSVLSEDQVWSRLLKEAMDTVQDMPSIGIHLQIDPQDPGGISPQFMSEQKLAQLARIVQPNLRLGVIGNKPHRLPHVFWPSHSSREARKEHAIRCIDRFKGSGLL